MLQPTTLTFLTDLKANNSKPWFDANRKVYETAKADFVQTVSEVITGLGSVDPDLANTSLQAKNCIFRINRDVRFSNNKSPYKTNFGAWFNKGGKKLNSAGYYLNLEPGNCFLAGGLYMPDPNLLARTRQEIDYNWDAFRQLLTTPDFVRYFGDLNREESLSRPPKGYTADNPAIDYLKLKSFTAWHHLPDDVLMQPDFTQRVTVIFGALQPLVAFLNRGLEEE